MCAAARRASLDRRSSRAFERFSGPSGLTFQPGLDGLRGLAVGRGRRCSTSGSAASRAATSGVSLFFTLSGMLIGSLMLNEVVATGRFSLRRFWLRRARRLLPPALVTFAVIASRRPSRRPCRRRPAATSSPAAPERRQLALPRRGSVVRRPVRRTVGGAPLLEPGDRGAVLPRRRVLSVLARGRARRDRSGPSAWWRSAWPRARSSTPFVLDLSVDRVYYGTDTRAGELMVGVAAAAVFASARRRRLMLRHACPARADRGAVALAATAGAVGRRRRRAPTRSATACCR